MFGDPVTGKAQAFGMDREIGGIGKRGSDCAAFEDGNEIKQGISGHTRLHGGDPPQSQVQSTRRICHVISLPMLTPLFPAFLFTALLIELTPGPNMAWLALTSAGEGKRAGFAAVAGIALGLGILGAASAVGLAELATRSPLVFSLLRYAGVAYLLWLVWQAWSGVGEVSPGEARDGARLSAWVRHGLLLNLLNPKAAVFFVVVLPAYISPGTAVMAQTLALSTSYVAIATMVHVVIVLLAGQAHDWLSSGTRQRVARRIFALMLAGIAIWFLVSSL
jgi:threonine/homoserine/homoserine lactone efflux protein